MDAPGITHDEFGPPLNYPCCKASSSTDPIISLASQDLSAEQAKRNQELKKTKIEVSKEEDEKVNSDNVEQLKPASGTNNLNMALSKARKKIEAESTNTGRLAWAGAATFGAGIISLMSSIAAAGGVTLLLGTGSTLLIGMATGGIGAIVIGLFLLAYALSRTSD